MDQQIATFMLTMDALMDTRIGTCVRLDERVSRALLKSKDYATRKSDYFAEEPRYQKLWQRRDMLTLCNSTGTRIFELLNHLLKNEESEPSAGAGDFELRIFLNTYPYTLSEAEIDIYKSVIMVHIPQLGSDANIRVMHVSDTDLTPNWLAVHAIDSLVMYQWQDWLEMHQDALLEVPQPLLHLIGPKLRKYAVQFTAGEDTKVPLELLNKDAEFDAAELGLQPIIALRTMPIEFFNSIISIRA